MLKCFINLFNNKRHKEELENYHKLLQEEMRLCDIRLRVKYRIKQFRPCKVYKKVK